jgi:S-DNA-T family DNA segregation ATPase FtsK/SpoIIIE
MCSILGVDENGTPTLVRLSSPDVAHVLICGSTGSGKTVLARSMIASLVMHNSIRQLQMILIDPKGRGFGPFEGIPHLLCPILRESDEARGRLQWLVHEMERRDREGITAPRIVIFIDEFADLILVGGTQVEKAMTRLSQRGRQAGLHLVACTQKPMAAVIGSLVKSNFPVRAVGSVTSAEDARVATGLPGTGAEKLAGRGDFLLVNRGETLRFQAAHASDADILALVAGLQRRDGQVPADIGSSARERETHPAWIRRKLRVVRS